jgi:hypothetical protein
MKTDNVVCRLIVERNIYPATRWHWVVEMPDGHQYALSADDFWSLQECMEHACRAGVMVLEDAERLRAVRAHLNYAHLNYAREEGVMAARAVEEADEDEDEIGWEDPLAGCLVLFACGVIFVMALLGWGIWLACGRWPALCRVLPPAGAVLLGMGIAALIGYARRRGRV